MDKRPLECEYSFNFCIDDPNVVDIVILWVNGSDPVWYKRMMKDKKKNHLNLDEKFISQRYVEHNELKWALRSIQKFAPWVNMIHLVTDKQYPSWIKTDNPNINWVNHDDIFYDGFHSYASSSIQMSLINIRNISRRFIIMDDDYLFLNNITIDDFFDDQSRTKQYYSQNVVKTGCSDLISASIYHYTRRRAYNITNEMFNFSHQIFDAHVPIPLDMTVLFQLENDIDVLEMRFRRFRSCRSYQFQSLYIQYSYGKNKSILKTIDNKTLHIWKRSLFTNLYTSTTFPSFVCANVYDPYFLEVFLPSIFPQKSTFEN